MWLFTTYGFFSATRSREDTAKMQIRARAKKDLLALRGAARIRGLFATKKAPPILDTPGADYRWRIIITPAEWAIILAMIGEEIDYPNFKDRIHDIPEQADKLPILHSIWGKMWEYQRQHDGKA